MVEAIVNFLHLLATAVWLGGAVYIHLILLPSLRLIDPQQGGKLLGIVAKRFSIAAWSSIVVLLITGYLKTPSEMLFDASSDMGFTLLIKHLLIVGVILVGLVIGLYVVPRMGRNAPKPGEAPSGDFIRYQKRLHALATTNLILGLFVLVCASMLW